MVHLNLVLQQALGINEFRQKIRNLSYLFLMLFCASRQRTYLCCCLTKAICKHANTLNCKKATVCYSLLCLVSNTDTAEQEVKLRQITSHEIAGTD